MRGCGARITVNDLALTIARIMGKNISPSYLPARKGDIRDSQADIGLAAKNLGWKPKVSLDAGLQRTVEWFLAH